MSRSEVTTETSTSSESSDDGDIVLRSGREPESSVIRSLAQGRFSHAGICSRGDLREVVDAYPRDPASAVAKTTIEDFFHEEHAADGGGIYRYKGASTKARAAARYAEDQCTEHFVFDIRDPILGFDLELRNNNKLYCSEFVWRCFRDGANVVLVAPEDFADFLAPANLNNIARVLGEYETTRRLGRLGKLIPSPVAAAAIRPKFKHTPHNGRFITPDQLANSAHVSLLREIPPRAGGEARLNDEKTRNQ
jgi:Permuted papain-like amidase enzyme, YaeF/YiiX, C92 family